MPISYAALLQVALLDQLAAHAGMRVGLEGGEQPEGTEAVQEGQTQAQTHIRTQEQRAREQQGHAWVGGGGSWWVAQEEAGQGRVLGPTDDERMEGSQQSGEELSHRTFGWLEGHHSTVVMATLREWMWVDRELAAEAGVPAAPPPLLAARLAARAAEALCRLCRGQGLAGLYGPAPTWRFSMAPVRAGNGTAVTRTLHSSYQRAKRSAFGIAYGCGSGPATART